MVTSLEITSGPLELVAKRARDYAADAKADNTRRAYRSDWRRFESWCARNGLESLPATPAAVAFYLSAHAGMLKASTLIRHLATISQAHKTAGLEAPTASPEVRAVFQGIKRVHGTAANAKQPVLVPELRRMVAALPSNTLGVRDRALLLLGFAGAFRRSELVAVDVEDLEPTSDGVTVTVRHSKTDQEHAGRKVGIPYGSDPATCPVRSVKAWLEISGITTGALFRSVTRHGRINEKRLSDRAVAEVVKRAARAAGLDPAELAGHSLRAGLATSAAKAGKSERSIMAQTGHRSVIVARRYIRDGGLFTDNAAAGIGL